MTVKHVGIMACSAEGAALCYRTICSEGAERFGAHNHPEISLHSHPLAAYMECIYRDDWRGVGELMLSTAQRLEAAGADFLVCPDNTIHQALSFIAERLPLPMLPIAETVAAAAAGRGFRRLGLTGTRYLVESEVYPAALEAAGLEWVRPEAEQRQQINHLIMNELVYGVLTAEAEAYFQSVIAGLKQAGCDAVVLGCTEIPLLMNDSNSPLPTLDSTRLLARAALEYAGEAGDGSHILAGR